MSTLERIPLYWLRHALYDALWYEGRGWTRDELEACVWDPETKTSIRVSVLELQEEVARRSIQQKMDLTAISTRQLLRYLHFARKFGGFFSPCGESNDFGTTVEDLKKELATREHVPNKKEARAIRQRAAFDARRGKQRNRARRPVAQR